jgi:hypothetical protein
MSKIPPQQLEQAADLLQAVADELRQISTWLTMGDEDRAAIVLEDAWQTVGAAENLVRRRIRRTPAGWLHNGASYGQYGLHQRGREL